MPLPFEARKGLDGTIASAAHLVALRPAKFSTSDPPLALVARQAVSIAVFGGGHDRH